MVKKRVIKSPVKKLPVELKLPDTVAREADFKNYLNIFEFEITLPGSGETIKIKPLTTGQIKQLLIYEGIEDDFDLMTKIFDDIIRESVITESFDLSQLYLQDRFYLLLEIRKKTKGSIHQFEYTCEECESQSMQKIDLDTLPMTSFPEIDFIIKINDDISVRMDFLKRINEFEATEALKIIKEQSEKAGKKLKELQEQAEFSLLLEASGIQEILLPEGSQPNLSIFDKKYFLENIPKFLYQKIKDWYEASDFGVDFFITIECEHCKNKVDIEISYDNFFF